MDLFVLIKSVFRMYIFILIHSISTHNTQTTLEFFLNEECLPNTIVGNLNDLPYNSAISSHFISTFQLVSQSNLFLLNETSGLLFTRNRIDREIICTENRQSSTLLTRKINDYDSIIHDGSNLPNTINTMGSQCEITLQILQFINEFNLQTNISPSQSQQHRVILAKIYIMDINDNPPSWKENVIQIQIPEHTPIGTQIPLPTAYDPDCGPTNTTVSYSLIEPKNPTDSTHSDLLKKFNYAARNAFQLDADLISSPEMNQNIWNYRPIICSPRVFRLWLRITQDLDFDDDSKVIADNNLPKPYPTTDSVKLKNLKLTLTASDSGQPVSLTGSVLINITVTDINDHAPEFITSDRYQDVNQINQHPFTSSKTLHSENGDIVVQVPENTPAGRTIYQIQAIDRDESDREKLRYSLGTSADLETRELFRIDSKTGEIVLIGSPDFEKHQSYLLPITVSDGKHLVTHKLIVQIQNINDHPPVITVRPVGQQKSHQPIRSGSSNYAPLRTVILYVTEHDPPGQFIGTVTVSDVDEINQLSSNIPEISTGINYPHQSSDLDAQNLINCQLNHNGLILEPLFKGARNQFKLLTQASFDREKQPEQFITLTCFDRGQPPLSSQVGLRLLIEDINDHGPQFKQTKMITHLKENSQPGTKVYKIEAHDPDIGSNAELGYRLDGSYVDYFTIDPKTGTITSLRPFDREQIDHFNLSIIVYDQADLNTIDTNSNIDHQNHENNQTDKYDYKTNLNHNLFKQHISYGNLYVFIDDVNDCVPTFENSLYQLTVSEDAKVNHLIGQIEANDSDATDNNNQIHYLIKPQSEGQTVQEFRVSNKGYIHVARGNLDREKVPTYIFYLVAIDNGQPSLSSSTQIHIHLIDVNDNIPQWIFPIHNHQIINLTINEPVGYRVAQLLAEDPDENENGEVIYRLIQTSIIANIPEVERLSSVTTLPSRSDINSQIVSKSNTRYNPSQGIGNLFELDSISGAIYVGRSMTPNDIGSIKLVLEASDKGKPAKINHRVLQIDIFRYLTQSSAYLLGDSDGDGPSDSEHGKYRNTLTGSGSYLENDLIVIVIMVAVTLIISLILILAILFLRCGACPTRTTVHNEQNDPRYYRHNLNHTHHLEEVFRDSGMMEGDGLLSPNSEQLSDCNRLNDGSMNSFHHHHRHHIPDTDMMLKSFLSSPDNNQWMMTTIDPKKNIQCSADTIRSHKIFGSIHPFHPSPTRSNDGLNYKQSMKSGTITRLKRVDETNSAKNSPEHAMKLLVGPCPLSKQVNQPCSTFRASCSQLAGLRVNSAIGKDPGLMRNLSSPNEIVEDMESMDSGHGCSTDTGVIPSFEVQCPNSRPQTSMNTFPVNNYSARQTPTCYCALTTDHSRNPILVKNPQLLPINSDELPMRLIAYRSRSGTLPPGSCSLSDDQDEELHNQNKTFKLNAAKSSGDLLKNFENTLNNNMTNNMSNNNNNNNNNNKLCVKQNCDSQTKNRLSVSWLDSQQFKLNGLDKNNVLVNPIMNNTHKENTTHITLRNLSENNHNNNHTTHNINNNDHMNCDVHDNNNNNLNLFNTVDPLGYAQLIHSQSDEIKTDTNQDNIYTKFPTSFV